MQQGGGDAVWQVAAEIEGRDCCEVVHGTARPISQCPFLRLSKSLHRETTELAMDDRYFHMTVDPVFDAKGKLTGAVHTIRDITAHKRAEKELEAINQSLEEHVAERTEAIRMLHEHLLTAAENVQRRIAQDLHDDVGQELTGLGLKAETLAEMLAAGRGSGGKARCRYCGRRGPYAEQGPRALAETVAGRNGRGLLVIALERLAITTTTGSRIACTLDCSHPDSVFDERVAMHLYRIAQEAVSNAVRHSRAQNIRITLDQEQRRDHLEN